MKVAAIGLPLLLAALVALSGCIFGDPGYCDGFAGSAEWTDRELYESFPSPGMYGAYEVEEHRSSKDATKIISKGDYFTLQVYNNTKVNFRIYHPKELSQAESYDRLELLYRDLGLGDPPPESTAQFHWARLCG